MASRSAGDLPYSESELEQTVYATGSVIPLPAFQIVTGLVFSLAIICAVARSIMRLIMRRPLYWDDFFLAVGTTCFVAATGIFYKNIFYYYLLSAVQLQPSLVPFVSIEMLGYLLTTALPQLTAMTACTWTTIFCVKASFLIISKRLIVRLPWLTVYFWIVAALTACSWVILICAPFIECPYTGWESVGRCQGTYRDKIYVVMNGVTAALDMFTDVLIASIPLIILKRACLKPQQKLLVGPFLCLSLVMIVIAAIRISKLSSTTNIDIGWLVFWQYLEAGIAIIVTAITTLRTVFTTQKKSRLPPAIATWPYRGGVAKGRVEGTSDNTDSISEDSHSIIPGRTTVMGKSLPNLSFHESQIFVHETWAVTFCPSDPEHGDMGR